MGYAERANITRHGQRTASQSKRIGNFLGGGRVWYCLMCGSQANLVPEADGSKLLVCPTSGCSREKLPKE